MNPKILQLKNQGILFRLPFQVISFLLVMLLIHASMFLQASVAGVWQNKVVTGTISDAMTGELLVGVNIVIKGTTTGAVSDINGNFSLEIPDQETILRITYIGYLTEEITVMPGPI
jgi:TonB-dependent starch-binding outer membrane protein SusC